MPGRFRQVNEARPCGGAAEDGRASAAKIPPVPPPGRETGGACSLSAHNEENARRAGVLRRASLLPRAPELSLPVCILPSQEALPPNGGLSSRRHCRFGASLRPQCRSRGVLRPVSFRQAPGRFRPLRYPPHSILGHDSVIRLCDPTKPPLSYSIRQEKSTACPLQNGSVQRIRREGGNCAAKNIPPWEPCRAKPPGGMRSVYAGQPSAAARRRSSSA